MRGRQSRHGHPWRPGGVRRPDELPVPSLHGGTGGHHRRRCQHPDPLPDRVRTGRDALSSLAVEGVARGGGSGAGTGPAAVRPGVSRSRRTPAGQPRTCRVSQPHRWGPRQRSVGGRSELLVRADRRAARVSSWMPWRNWAGLKRREMLSGASPTSSATLPAVLRAQAFRTVGGPTANWRCSNTPCATASNGWSGRSTASCATCRDGHGLVVAA